MALSRFTDQEDLSREEQAKPAYFLALAAIIIDKLYNCSPTRCSIVARG